MKFALSIAVLALAASQVAAVVPEPVRGCQKTVVVLANDTGCDDFARNNRITSTELLAWNLKLRTDCKNLDVGAPLCVAGPGAKVNTPTDGADKPSASKPPATTPTGGSSAVGSTVTHNSASDGARFSMVLALAGVVASVSYVL
ncbi:hypothetical protein B0O80DRAFT_495331 [Mortierella sp. GBAus27b]|nr:hypothetical protein B0O80DRAFT_495331 [Mortierella sp. GBAus27b]